MASARSRSLAAIGALLIAAAILGVRKSDAAENLLRNGDFSEGTGNTPAYWYPEQWIDLPTTQHMWLPPSGGEPGMAVIQNQVENAASWSQSVHLDPGWYYVGAEVKATCEGKDKLLYGALVTLTDLGIVSAELKPMTDWQNSSFYVEVGDGGAQVEVALRLACFPTYKKGQAFFRGASVVKVDSPPPQARQFHLDQSRDHFYGRHWTMLLLVVPLLIAAAAGWILLPPEI